jgi:hypothetical protein
MASLESALQHLAQQTANALLRALAQSSLEQLASLRPEVTRRRAFEPRARKLQGKREPAATHPKGRRGRPPKAAGATKATKAAKTRPQPRRTAAQLDALAARVIEFVRQRANSHPEGQGVGEIARALRVDPRELGRPMLQAIAQGALRKTGQKNSTRYFPGEAEG